MLYALKLLSVPLNFICVCVCVCVCECDYTYIQPRAERSHEFQEDSQRYGHMPCVCAESLILSAITGCLGPLDCAPFEITVLENGFPLTLAHIRDPGSSVGIATGYGLDGPGSNPGGGENFHTCSDWPWGPPNLRYNGYRIFPGG